MKLTYAATAVIMLGLYYNIDYKRDFIYSPDKSKVITVWKRIGNRTWIIPGKYRLPVAPRTNFINTVTRRNYLGIMWNTQDNFHYKLSIYNEFESVSLSEKIKTYAKHDSLLLEYQIIKYDDKKKRHQTNNADYLDKFHELEYYDISGLFGIRRIQ